MKLMIMLLLSSLKAYPETRVFEGLARQEGQLVYSERHTQTLEGGKLISDITEYTDPNGKKIGSLKSRYSTNPQLPEHIFRDDRAKHLWGLRRTPEKVEIFFQDKQGTYHRGSLISTDTSKLVAGPGLIAYVQEHMEKILGQGGDDIQLIIPGKIRAYDFEIQPLPTNSDEVSFEVRLKTWWLRYFSPRLKLTFNRSSKRLTGFEGLSGLRDQDGDMMSVDITYDYSIQ